MSTCQNPYTSQLPAPSRTNIEENYCLGIGLNLDQWENYWINSGNTHTNCTTLFSNKIFSGPNRSYNQTGFTEVMEDFDYIFSTYLSPITPNNQKGGHIIGVPGQSGYDDFQQILVSACSDNPQFSLQGACQMAASKICLNCNLDQITSNRDLLKMCGCQKSSLQNIPQYQKIDKACDPLCVQEQISKNRNVNTGVIESCTSNICVINNVSITATESTVGGIQFTQLCPSCTGNMGCICIVDTTIPSIGKAVGLSNQTTFNQFCGSESVCLTIDNATQNSTVVPCQSTDIANLKAQTFWFPVPIWVWIILGFLILIFILVLIAANYAGYNQKVTEIKNTTPQNNLDKLKN